MEPDRDRAGRRVKLLQPASSKVVFDVFTYEAEVDQEQPPSTPASSKRPSREDALDKADLDHRVRRVLRRRDEAARAIRPPPRMAQLLPSSPPKQISRGALVPDRRDDVRIDRPRSAASPGSDVHAPDQAVRCAQRFWAAWWVGLAAVKFRRKLRRPTRHQRSLREAMRHSRRPPMNAAVEAMHDKRCRDTAQAVSEMVRGEAKLTGWIVKAAQHGDFRVRQGSAPLPMIPRNSFVSTRRARNRGLSPKPPDGGSVASGGPQTPPAAGVPTSCKPGEEQRMLDGAKRVLADAREEWLEAVAGVLPSGRTSEADWETKYGVAGDDDGDETDCGDDGGSHFALPTRRTAADSWPRMRGSAARSSKGAAGQLLQSPTVEHPARGSAQSLLPPLPSRSASSFRKPTSRLSEAPSVRRPLAGEWSMRQHARLEQQQRKRHVHTIPRRPTDRVAPRRRPPSASSVGTGGDSPASTRSASPPSGTESVWGGGPALGLAVQLRDWSCDNTGPSTEERRGRLPVYQRQARPTAVKPKRYRSAHRPGDADLPSQADTYEQWRAFVRAVRVEKDEFNQRVRNEVDRVSNERRNAFTRKVKCLMNCDVNKTSLDDCLRSARDSIHQEIITVDRQQQTSVHTEWFCSFRERMLRVPGAADDPRLPPLFDVMAWYFARDRLTPETFERLVTNVDPPLLYSDDVQFIFENVAHAFGVQRPAFRQLLRRLHVHYRLDDDLGLKSMTEAEADFAARSRVAEDMVALQLLMQRRFQEQEQAIDKRMASERREEEAVRGLLLSRAGSGGQFAPRRPPVRRGGAFGKGAAARWQRAVLSTAPQADANLPAPSSQAAAFGRVRQLTSAIAEDTPGEETEPPSAPPTATMLAMLRRAARTVNSAESPQREHVGGFFRAPTTKPC
eukprot:TRINITY_DN32839_c0_g1_i1.p1 TRINITY_DN32839_c0_g1~~TRINITY_DN32839_c0_g1_i1.p1  ORF type:complete len:902 (+),score=261.02 TRINITY_DN32839_c0_g1_i1:46-2751(+)